MEKVDQIKKSKRGIQKGTPKHSNAGRKKGVPNRTTAQIREAYANLISNNIPKFESWINDVAHNDPERALKLILELSVYVIPKLASTELKVEDMTNSIDYSKLSDEELNKLIELNEKLL